MTSIVAFEKVSTDDGGVLPEVSPVNLSRSKTGKVKQGKSISWSNVTFTVKDKYVLKDCWGEVR